MLVRLLYASRAEPALDDDAVAQVLRTSRAYNAAHGITGLLCISDGLVLQLLEGGRAAVSALYHRIAADRRHSGVELMAFDEIGERGFAGWAMGRVDVGRLNAGLLLKYSEQPRLDPFALSARSARALFDELMATASISCDA